MAVVDRGLSPDAASGYGSHMDNSRLAVLIDADNASADLIEPLLAEVATYGVASVKRIYGDWTQPNLGSWKQKLVAHAIQPMQQFGYTTGKNATDSALIIDAMDLLYTGNFDGFCLVSSDSDFTRLATRLRESGKKVYGFGERKTPRSLIAACDKFVYVDILRPDPPEAPVAKGRVGKGIKTATQKAVGASPKPAPSDKRLRALFDAALEASADDDGWAHLGAIGQYINKQQPDFDARNYGQKRLSDLVKAAPGYELQTRKSADGKVSTHYMRKSAAGKATGPEGL